MKQLLIAAVVVGAVIAGGFFFYPSTQAPHEPELAGETDRSNSDMLAGKAGLAVRAGDLNYFENAKGYYAEPEKSGAYPGIIMIHEWWGLNDNVREMAEELAKEGYRVLAVDLFGKLAATPDEARAQVGSLDEMRATGNLKAAAAHLRSKGSEKIASLGWCFGGGQSLKLALSGEKLDATVIYYGALITNKSELQKIKWPILGIFGDKDASIPTATVYDFRDALTFLGIPNSVHVYPGVGHAFANPSGANYAPEETKDAWAKTLSFLGEALK
ncbi:dienelactone hydrolase family protein [Candidatus Parcubacteria bacterium]|nr:MAG: dienelactone hydrolase family protein [Candidatus Parcubacteria bacterium]